MIPKQVMSPPSSANSSTSKHPNVKTNRGWGPTPGAGGWGAGLPDAKWVLGCKIWIFGFGDQSWEDACFGAGKAHAGL